MESRTGVELRAEGRTLSGAALPYGAYNPTFRERWLPGSARVIPDLAPTLGHRSGRVLAYGSDVEVENRAEALVVRARLPRTEVADIALDGVKRGRYRGWSVEFHARRETRDLRGVRVIEKALVNGLALVPHPSYPGTEVEIRQRGIRRIRARIRPRRKMACSCAGQGADASQIEFAPDAFQSVVEKVKRGEVDVLGIVRGDDSAFVSTTANTLRLDVPRGGGLEVDATGLEATGNGRDVAEQVASGVPVYARPILDFDASDFETRGDVAYVKRAEFWRVLIRPVGGGVAGLNPVDATEGREALQGPGQLVESDFPRDLGGLAGEMPREAARTLSTGSGRKRNRGRLWL